MPVKHSKVSALADGADATQVRPSDWNAEHALTLVGLNGVRVGTAANQNRWYSHFVGGTALATQAAALGNLRAHPFFCPRDMTVDQLAINVTTLLAGNAVIGLYSDDGNAYPATLLTGSANLATGTAGVKTHTVSPTLSLKGGTLYWLAQNFSANTVCRAVPLAAADAILGLDSALGTAPGIGWTVAAAFAALPATFPSNATVLTGLAPAVFLRASA